MSERTRTQSVKLGRIYLTCLALGGVVTHLASEFFAMGTDADSIVLSPRHAYLGLVAVACIAFLVLEGRRIIRSAENGLDLKRLLCNAIEALPLGGRSGFYLLTALLQVGVGLGTAVGEGCFFCGHDVIGGIIGALLTSLALALAARLLAARLPKLAAQFAALLPASDTDAPLHALRTLAAPPSAPRFVFWSTHLANRPPPVPNTP